MRASLGQKVSSRRSGGWIRPRAHLERVGGVEVQVDQMRRLNRRLDWCKRSEKKKEKKKKKKTRVVD